MVSCTIDRMTGKVIKTEYRETQHDKTLEQAAQEWVEKNWFNFMRKYKEAEQ